MFNLELESQLLYLLIKLQLELMEKKVQEECSTFENIEIMSLSQLLKILIQQFQYCKVKKKKSCI